MKYGFYPRNAKEYDILRTEIAGMPVKNPIGIAAGFDKDAEVIGY